MLPHEVQALMAKVLFFIFALTMFAMTKVRGEVPAIIVNHHYSVSINN